MSQKRLKKIKKQVVLESEKNVKVFLPSFWEIIKKNWIFLLVISILGILIYANGLKGDFVSDDYASITQESQIGNFQYMFTKAGMPGNSQFLLTYLVYKLFGNSSPVPYHLASLICFLIFNVIAYVFLVLIIKKETISKLAMLLFVVLPIHVEAVTWISGRIYIILGIYILLSFIGFVYYLDTGKYKYLGYSVMFFVLGFLTDRPRPFAVFFLILLYIFYVGWNNVKDRIIKLWWVVALLAVISFAVAWPYIKTRIGIVNSGVNASDSIFYNPFFQYPTSIPKYLQLLWFPFDLTLYHTLYVLPNWLNWLILVNYLALIIYFYFVDKRYFLALSFIFVSIIPSISPIKVSWLVAERYIFLGSLGFCLFLALLIYEHSFKLKIVMPTIFISLMLLYTVRTYLRNIDWLTNHNLWVNTCQVSPNSHNAWNNIGDDYDKLKDYSNAIKGFTQSVLVKPNYADAYHNRANIFFKIGRLDMARESYETALRFNPTLYQTYLSLTQIDLYEKRLDLALTHANKAVELQPNDVQSNYILGVVAAQIGKIDEAGKIFKSILSVYPNYSPAAEALKSLDSIINSQKK